MRKIYTALTVFAFILYSSVSVSATAKLNQRVDEHKTLNQVIFPVSMQAWVSTKSARVIVGMNAALKSTDVGKLRDNLFNNLQRIARVDWHITQWTRMKDSTGLESIVAQAQARLPRESLDHIRSKLEKLSKPGTQYNLVNIYFTPSLAAVEKTKMMLRQKIYEQINSELASLRKIYPDQSFSVHEINFYGTPIKAISNQFKAARTATEFVAPESVGMAVSKRIQLNASVVLASEG